MALVLHVGGVGKCVSLIWGWVHHQESGDLQPPLFRPAFIVPLADVGGCSPTSLRKKTMDMLKGTTFATLLISWMAETNFSAGLSLVGLMALIMAAGLPFAVRRPFLSPRHGCRLVDRP
jgi:hypothetical protein